MEKALRAFDDSLYFSTDGRNAWFSAPCPSHPRARSEQELGQLLRAALAKVAAARGK
jgi:hypothetical protein